MPDAFRQLEAILTRLEARYRDMQDVEFTIQDGKLWMLQTRSGKRTTEAALKIAVDLADEGAISREEAVMRVDPAALDKLLHPTIDPSADKHLIAKGLAASPGAASGEIVFEPDEAEKLKANGHEVILVRVETSPEDIHGMHAAAGILTARGGMTSHAAVVARGMGRPCVCGAGALRIDYAASTVSAGGEVLRKGDIITIDGATGEVMKGRVKMRQPELSGDFGRLMGWADRVRRLGVRANADTPRDARQARRFGAEGIGLCRTEHMFFEGDRIRAVREMILAGDEAGRRRALAKLLPMQKEDFKGILRIMGNLPVTIRTLDPPLHEFLPKHDDEVVELADVMNVPVDVLRDKVNVLQEFNPMLGHRGCRLGISYPEITEMQAQAIFEAACELRVEGKNPFPEVMIPLVGSRQELHEQRIIVERIAKETQKKYGVKVRHAIGTMIELPRACMVADEIAAEAEFFSFGTNDLTQTCLGLSRDDAGKFLPTYVLHGILPEDPFISIDRQGVGALMRIGVAKGRKTRKNLEIGICGEHGGDPRSVAFCHEIGLTYVSCSPYRVAIAKLAAAQATLTEKTQQ
jgi:pyruvate,orthophosphate dikinase